MTKKKLRRKKFHFNLAFIIRILIFIIVVYFSISYLSRSNTKINLPSPDILGTTYQYLPSDSQQTLNNFKSAPAIIYLQSQMDIIKKLSDGFPQKQITDIKKAFIQNIYQNVMDSIENPPPK